MDGGERLMTKLISIFSVVFILAFSFTFTTFAANTDDGEIEYYEGLDDYEEFEKDYYQTFEPQQKEPTVWYKDLSPIPILIGVAVGAGTVFVLYRKQTSARRQSTQHPHTYKADIKHVADSHQNDNTL